jgi:hypothetical protein
MIHYRQAPWILILCLIDGRNLEGQVGVSWRHPEQGVLILTNFNTEGCVRSIQLYVGTWNTFHHFIEDMGKPRKSVSRWKVPRPSRYTLTLASSPVTEECMIL